MRRRSLAIVTILTIVGVTAILAYWATTTRIPSHSVLAIELSGDLDERPPSDLLSRLQATGPSMTTLLQLLDMAAADSRVDGVLLHVKQLSLRYPRIQELRTAMQRVRDGGKRVIALVDVESLNATRELYLASAADQVFVDPAGVAPLAGLTQQVLLYAGLFEKIGVQWEYSRVGEYKSAVEQLSARKMSPEARRNAEAISDGLFSQVVEGIAAGRGLTPARVRDLVERGISTADELLDAKLVDGLVERKDLLERAGLGGAKELEVEAYLRVDPRSLGIRTGPKIALIFGEGVIVDQRTRVPFAQLVSDEVVPVLDAAADDDEIRAVVLRINSTGGVTHPSEKLWRAVMRVRAKKPIVVSMSDVAASGGYYVASGASAIVAEPATITGSIGVFALRPAYDGLYQKLDIGREVISRGPYAEVAAGSARLTGAQRQWLDAETRSTYQRFLRRISEGRGMEISAIDELGRGRVWLGSEAFDRKLVDELGGLDAAIARARREAHIENQPDPERVILPEAPGLLAQLRDFASGGSNARVLRAFLPGDGATLAGLDQFVADRATLLYLSPWQLDFL